MRQDERGRPLSPAVCHGRWLGKKRNRRDDHDPYWHRHSQIKADAPQDYDTFYKFMDGSTNPIGRWYTNRELEDIFSAFMIHSRFTSHFPLRYLKIGKLNLSKIIPHSLHRFLDTRLGMMRHFQLSKKVEEPL